ncbi:MAG: ATP-binding protein, partial [Verrucomicrobia bacterium]|nr:ATP-binding protein [Verrucomicrobiota bacterium]
ASPIIYQAQRGAVVFVQDITARKQAEEALRATEARIRKMLEMSPVPMCHLTGDGMFEFRNKRFVRVSGYTAADVPSLGEWWRRAFPDPQYRQWAIESWDAAVRHATAGERDTAGLDYKITCKSGEERIFEISGIMLGEELLVTFIDVTEHKLAQEIARKFNVELEQQVRQRTASLEAAVKELDAFAYSVSHDLRAPLRHVGGYAGLLRTSAGPSLPETSRHYLDEITGAATQMGRLIDDLLQFSRMGRTEMRQERIELTGLAEECIQQLKPEINGRNILWQQNPLPAVQADPALLRQVLINLLSNAIKYTRPRDPAKIEIGCASENGQETVIYVRDNGVGFDMEYSNKLFGVFQRLHADDEFEGTGVGLANVRRIIARHGGRTWAEGKVNEGATFYFSLPI